MIYADNAATTKLCKEAYDAMQPYLIDQFGNASQPYSFAKSAKIALKKSRETIAECIGANPDEIYFTSGGTESDNCAIKSVLFANKNKNKIITSQIEHHAILNSCRTVESLGISAEYIPVDNNGIIQPEFLENSITDDTGLVSIMTANNEIGTIEPIEQLAEISHSHGAVFHTDAVQAVGHIPINVHKSNVDMLSASAHKFNGPKGIGFLYIKSGIKIHPYADGGSQEHRMRAGTENIPAIVGMASALKTNIQRINENTKHLHNLENIFINSLKSNNINFVRNGSENHLPGNVNISIRNSDGEMLLHRLDLKRICISTGSACDSVNTQVSHVIKAIHVPKEYAEGTIRITFSVNNTQQEAIAIANELSKILLK